MSLTVKATTRQDQGKGASRRLRKDNQIPAIVYGAGKKPATVSVNIYEITHLLDNEEAYTSIIDLSVGKKKESVIIKDLQRHPARNSITHIDFLRIDLEQNIVTQVPLHFIGEENNDELRLGAVLNQFITSIEVSCLPSDLPHAIDIDISSLELGDHISLTEINMPEGVVITALTHGDIEAHDQSVVAVQAAKKMAEIEEETVDEANEEAGANTTEDDAEKK